MLRKVMFMAVIIAAAMMVFSAHVYAASGPATGKTNSQKATASMKNHSSNRQEEMQQLWRDQQSLSDEWGAIEQHYNSMMQITDPTQLKAEMAKHQDMMKAYNDRMIAFQGDWHKDMAAYQPKTAASETTTPSAKKTENKTENKGMNNMPAGH